MPARPRIRPARSLGAAPRPGRRRARWSPARRRNGSRRAARRYGAGAPGGPALALASAAVDARAGHGRGRGRQRSRVGAAPAVVAHRRREGAQPRGRRAARRRRRCSSSTPAAATCAAGAAPAPATSGPRTSTPSTSTTSATSGSPSAGGPRLRDRKENQILKFTSDGRFLLQIGRRGQSQGSLDTANVNNAADLQVDPATNELYVADGYVNRRVIVYDADTGAFKRMWGAYGKPPDDAASREITYDGPPPPQFTLVHGIRVSRDGKVYVADRSNNRMQVFTTAGVFEREIFVERTTKLLGTAFSVAFSPDPEPSACCTWPTPATAACTSTTARRSKEIGRHRPHRPLRRPVRVPPRAGHGLAAESLHGRGRHGPAGAEVRGEALSAGARGGRRTGGYCVSPSSTWPAAPASTVHGLDLMRRRLSLVAVIRAERAQHPLVGSAT